MGEIQSRERAFYDAQVAEGGEPGPPRPGVRRFGTADEAPLGAAELALPGDVFERVELEYPSMYCFEALGRALGHRAILPLRRVDAALCRVLALRRYSYHVLITLAKCT